LCRDIYHARHITTVSLTANTNLAACEHRAINDRPVRAAGRHLLPVGQLVLRVSKPSISHWSQIKKDTVEPSVLAQDIII